MMGYSRWDTETFRMPNSVHNVIINEFNRNSLSLSLAGWLVSVRKSSVMKLHAHTPPHRGPQWADRRARVSADNIDWFPHYYLMSTFSPSPRPPRLIYMSDSFFFFSFYRRTCYWNIAVRVPSRWSTLEARATLTSAFTRTSNRVSTARLKSYSACLTVHPSTCGVSVRSVIFILLDSFRFVVFSGLCFFWGVWSGPQWWWRMKGLIGPEFSHAANQSINRVGWTGWLHRLGENWKTKEKEIIIRLWSREKMLIWLVVIFIFVRTTVHLLGLSRHFGTTHGAVELRL